MDDHSCNRCGKCCNNFPITMKRARKIKRVLKKSPELARLLVRSFDKKDCIFLLYDSNGKTKCAIYDKDVRPVICDIMGTKDFPDLECPEGTYSDKYSILEARKILNKEMLKTRKMELINTIFEPYLLKITKNKR